MLGLGVWCHEAATSLSIYCYKVLLSIQIIVTTQKTGLGFFILMVLLSYCKYHMFTGRTIILLCLYSNQREMRGQWSFDSGLSYVLQE